MRRREFITLLAGAAATWPLVGRAQQPSGKVYRIGYLGVASHAGYAREIEALLKGLHQLGYEEGKNIAIHYQFAEGDYNRLPALAAELVALKVDVLLTHSTPGARAARQTTPTVPIVVMAAADLVSSGLVPSIARPGGNLTGLTFFFAEICAKRVELIKEAVPGGNTAGRSRESRQSQRRGCPYGHAAYSSLVASGTSDGERESSGRHRRCICDADLTRGPGAHFYRGPAANFQRALHCATRDAEQAAHDWGEASRGSRRAHGLCGGPL